MDYLQGFRRQYSTGRGPRSLLPHTLPLSPSSHCITVHLIHCTSVTTLKLPSPLPDCLPPGPAIGLRSGRNLHLAPTCPHRGPLFAHSEIPRSQKASPLRLHILHFQSAALACSSRVLIFAGATACLPCFIAIEAAHYFASRKASFGSRKP